MRKNNYIKSQKKLSFYGFDKHLGVFIFLSTHHLYIYIYTPAYFAIYRLKYLKCKLQ